MHGTLINKGENILEDKIIFNVENIDIEDIIKQIHGKIEKRGYPQKVVQEFSLKHPPIVTSNNDGRQNIDILYKKTYIQYWWPIISFPGIKGKIKSIIKKMVRKLTFFYMQHVVEQQNEFNIQVANTMNIIVSENEDLKNKVNSLNSEISSIRDALTLNNARVDKLSNIYDKYGETIKEINKSYLINNTRITRLESALKEIASIELSDNEVETEAFNSLKSEHKFNYHLFENKFRGSINEIKNRQRKYVDYFIDKENILDIGCGRGEFLELLAENNVKSMGVDLSIENVEYCSQKGLNVSLQDGIDYLEGCADDSLGGIFAAQVIEHISNEELLRLLNLAYKKLKSDSVLVLETLNPKCLMIYAESFYMDPSHSKPVHPDTLKFMSETAGYSNSEILYMTPSEESLKIPYINNDLEFNKSVDRLNKLIYGEREYALVAKK